MEMMPHDLYQFKWEQNLAHTQFPILKSLKIWQLGTWGGIQLTDEDTNL